MIIIAESPGIEDYICEYPYIANEDETKNIVVFKDLLKRELTKNNTEVIDFEIGRRDTKYNIFQITKWKLISLFQTLGENDLVLSLSLDNLIIHNEAQNYTAVVESLGRMLKINYSIRKLSLNNKTGFEIEIANIIAKGIRENTGLKHLIFNGINPESLSAIVKAVGSNGNITHFECDCILKALIFSPDELSLRGVTHFTARIESDFLVKASKKEISKLESFFKKNNTIIKLDLDCDKYYQGVSEDPVRSILKTIFPSNKTLEKIPCTATYDLHTEIVWEDSEKCSVIYSLLPVCEITDSLFRNKDNNNRIVKLLVSLEFKLSTALDDDHLKALIGYHQIGKNLIEYKLKAMNYNVEEVIRAYGRLERDIYFKNYDYRADPNLEENEKYLELLFDEIIYILPKKKDVSITMNLIENYRNFYFFHLKGVSKDISNQGAISLPDDVWAKIALYLEFDDVQSSLQVISSDFSANEQELGIGTLVMGDQYTYG